VQRAGRAQHLVVTVAARPLESYPDLEVRYDEVGPVGSRLRAIVLRPPGAGPFPAVYYLQGYDCASIDCALPQPRPLRDLAAGLARAGFVVYRLEKSGVGDSEGPPCRELDFTQEATGFAAGLAALDREPDVRTDQVFLFGHSMGGLLAPVLAGGRPGLAGLVVYGGGVWTWVDYLQASRRHQMELAGIDPALQDERLQRMRRLDVELLVRGRDLPEILRTQPDLAVEPDLYGLGSDIHVAGRHYRYWQQVQALSVERCLRDLDLPVLAAWGAADWIALRVEHELLADLVNRHHPGRGRFVEVEGCDHGFAHHATEAASFAARGRGPFHPRVLEVTLAWMREVLAGAAG
jgi:pimeloyl-ACP methyl ester carboxylesterase